MAKTFMTEQELAQMLNERDAFAQVVFRLMEWFSAPASETPPFELADFQAIMMDAGLMDQEEYHVFLGGAREMAKSIRK